MATKKKTTILYLHVSASTKIWLKNLCKKQIGKVSQSNMAEQILIAEKNRAKKLTSYA